MKKTVEQKASEAILQKREEVEIGGVIYEVAPPSTATLILVSELVSQLPQIATDKKEILIESLRIARHCSLLGDIVAVLILGAKGLKEKRTVVKKRFFGLITETREHEVDLKKDLAKKVLTDLKPSELEKKTLHLLHGMETASFFGLTASLIEINLMKPTRKAGMTASGQ